MNLYSYMIVALMAAITALAHMEMKRPFALKSRYDSQNNWSNIDYDNTSPINPNGANFPCRGHHKTTPWRTVATYTAGQRDSMSLAPGVMHRGGSCQISLSYDNGNTFRVIQSYIGGCPLKLDWNFEIPAVAPEGKALFAWSWYNLEGNRELYMNCAHVEIKGGPSSDAKAFDALPEIFVANAGDMSCRTVEHRETVFAHPGKNVEYAGKAKPGDEAFPKCGRNA
ncbi:endoglucanase [Aspergillus avenaceus]|uniref:Endoglucanase n=1 Tax=Aspergillus avenaceus TaxID=36643 RepID=A0A5N6TU94_ASPAV|nr:endoglucanase [Aspergillus avenaceus]